MTKQTSHEGRDSRQKIDQELLLNFAEWKSDDLDLTKERILSELRQGFQELRDYKDGKIEFQSAESFLDEL